MTIEDQILSLIEEKDEYIVGFANLEGIVHEIYKDYPFAIVLGKKLDDEVIDSVSSGPNYEYLDLYNKTNKALSETAHKISENLYSMKIKNVIIEPTVNHQSLTEKYTKTLTCDFSHKMAGTRSGHGWIGKTGLFISNKFGPRLRLATVLTDYPLNCSNLPVDESKCGNCNKCVKSCPANAATGALWNKHMKRDYFYNPFKCLQMCKELTKKNLGKETSICGICISVCPVGKK